MKQLIVDGFTTNGVWRKSEDILHSILLDAIQGRARVVAENALMGRGNPVNVGHPIGDALWGRDWTTT